MNHRVVRAVVAAAAATIATAACQTSEPDSIETVLRTAVEYCIEDTHDSVTYKDDDTIVELRNVVTVDHPDAEDRLQITEVQCIQVQLDAPSDARIKHPNDIDHRVAYEWGDYRMTATHVIDGDGLTVDVIFYERGSA